MKFVNIYKTICYTLIILTVSTGFFQANKSPVKSRYDFSAIDNKVCFPDTCLPYK